MKTTRLLLVPLLALLLGPACATTRGVGDPESGRPDTGEDADEAADPVDLVTSPEDEYGWVRVVLVAEPADRSAGAAEREVLRGVLADQLEAEGIPRLRVVWHRGQLLVGIPGANAVRLERIRAIFEPRQVLSLQLVDDASDRMEGIAAWLGDSSGVKALEEMVPGGGGTVIYLWALQKNLLDDLLSRLPARLGPEPEREVLLGQQTYNDLAGLRTYYLERRRWITEDDVADVQPLSDPERGAPGVSISLNPGGARRLEALTRSSVGRRLAVVVRGRVQTAPLIREAITGGKVSLTLGGAGTPQQQEREARQLASVLRNAPRQRRLNLVQIISLQTGFSGGVR